MQDAIRGLSPSSGMARVTGAAPRTLYGFVQSSYWVACSENLLTGLESSNPSEDDSCNFPAVFAHATKVVAPFPFSGKKAAAETQYSVPSRTTT